MSDDRGCPCGLEKYEYEYCRNSTCTQRQRAFQSQVRNQPSTRPTRDELRAQGAVVRAAYHWKSCRDTVLESPQGDPPFKQKFNMLSEAESQLMHAINKLMGDEK